MTVHVKWLFKEENVRRPSFSGAARGGPACSGTHRKDSAERLPREARTTRSQCCLPHLQWKFWSVIFQFKKKRRWGVRTSPENRTYTDSPPAACSRCSARCEAPPWYRRSVWASGCCRDPGRLTRIKLEKVQFKEIVRTFWSRVLSQQLIQTTLKLSHTLLLDSQWIIRLFSNIQQQQLAVAAILMQPGKFFSWNFMKS